MISIYHALFNSHLSYASQIWGQNLSATSRPIKLQKTAVRLISFSDFNSHTQPLFNTTRILPLLKQIFIANTSLAHQILNCESPISVQQSFDLKYLTDSYTTRGQNAKLLSRPSVRTSSYGLKSIRYQVILNWNQLQLKEIDTDLTSISLSKLKSLSRKLLLNS